MERPRILIAHRIDEPPPFLELSGGDRVVVWEFLVRDLPGTFGWRPGLLDRLEGPLPAARRPPAPLDRALRLLPASAP